MSDKRKNALDIIDNALDQISAIADIIQLIKTSDTLDRLRVETLPTLGTILDAMVEEIRVVLHKN